MLMYWTAFPSVLSRCLERGPIQITNEKNVRGQEYCTAQKYLIDREDQVAKYHIFLPGVLTRPRRGSVSSAKVAPGLVHFSTKHEDYQYIWPVRGPE